MLDELAIYNLSVKYPNTIDLVREVERIAKAEAIDEYKNIIKSKFGCNERINMDICSFSDECRLCGYEYPDYFCALDKVAEQLKEQNNVRGNN